MKKLTGVVLCAACAGVAWMANAEWVSEEDARKAAEAFVKSDAVGRVVLSGCDVAAISQRGNIWVVALSPSGQVLLSRSDLADPIVGFSKNDFSEPDPDSPAYAYLAGIDASLAALESNGGTRHDRWNRLLSGGTGKRLLRAADIANPDTVVISPFLESHYNQWQPYNDYSPVYKASTNNLDSYRGRCPCGCVATAAAQGFRHFRWPARMDRVDSFNHDFTDTNKVTTSFPLRFNGHVPMDWVALEDDYINRTSVCVTNYYSGGYSWWWETNYDLRGSVQEAKRHPIARLVMFADVLAHMLFGADGSGANYGTVASNASDWYTPGTWVPATDSRVLADIANGIPVQISIPGHAVVGHGWATDGANDKYIYLNYGWGGSNDGYYNINGSTIEEVYVGHYPRAKPQIDPLPKVCGTSLTLNWHFPDFYTNNLSGFTVSISRPATTPSTFLDDFSASSGTSSLDEIYIDGENELLYSDYAASGDFTYPQSFILTSASELYVRVSSYAAVSSTMEIQARFNGGAWQTVLTPDLDEEFGPKNWNSYRIYLGGHGGEAAQFRIVRGWGGIYYIDENENRVDYGFVRLDDFTVTKVLAPVEPEIQNVGKTARSRVLNELEPGATYSFTVTPNISDALVSGESSDHAMTFIAGTRNTPIPGEQTYTPTTLSFSASDASGTWSYSGTAVDDTSVGGAWNCSITCIAPGEITSTSTLSFDWTANDYYGVHNGVDSYDVLSATFTASDGAESPIWSITNTSVKTSRQKVSCSLAALNGQTGKIVISYSHKGGGYGRGGVIYAPTVTNVLVPSVPDVEWDTKTLTALGSPEILSVSSLSEGFYRECGLGATAFDVTCSESVTSLEALPSHLALVDDGDVSVTPKGNGRFTVTVTPRGITADNARSRMILTLAATDSNGTTAYKDLSLRFAPVDAVVSAVKVDATTSSGDAFSVDVPYEWVEANGLVPAGSAASAYEAALAAKADADGDGIPNWAEFVCGTCPTNSSSKLTATIRMENGTPVVGYDPSDGIISGFKAVIKGTNDLSEDFSNWQVTTGTTSLHFYRVEIIPE